MADETEPYKAEYAKSNRSSCKSCSGSIAQGDLRLAVMVPSAKFDGKIPYWFHKHCFFRKHKPKAVGDICKFDGLRVEDQKYIVESIAAQTNGEDAGASGGKVKKATKRAKKGEAVDCKVEIASSNRSTCIGCEQRIVKDDVRCAKMDYESEKAMRFGGIPRWYHVSCFAECRPDTEFWDSGTTLPGYSELSPEQKKLVKDALPKMAPVKKEEDGPSPSKLPKIDNKAYEAQNKKLYKLKDQLMTLSGTTLKSMLTHNKMEVPVGKERILDALVDAMMFGALEICPECGHGNVYYRNSAYHCGGQGEWASCEYTTKEPKRRLFKIQKGLKEKHEFLEKLKCKVGKRIMLELERSSQSSSAIPVSLPTTIKVERPKGPLDRMQFIIVGSLSKPTGDIKKDITRLGGITTTTISETTMAVITSEAVVKKNSGKLSEAEAMDVHVLPLEFLKEVEGKSVDETLALVKKMALTPWGGEPSTRLQKSSEYVEEKLKSKSRYVSSSGSSKVKLTMKNGAYVDPESGLEKKAHVFKEGNDLYTAVMSKADLAKGSNSYYKLQLLESDNKARWWVFRAWGRIGTTMGSKKVEEFDDPEDAIDNFCEVFMDHTGNQWKDHNNFKKKPGMYMLMDLDMGQDKQQNIVSLEGAGVKSNLPEPVQDLMKMIFDVKAMEKTMVEFELDLEKMPLGKLSERQIRDAFSELAKLQDAIHDVKKPSKPLIMAASNRFYTLIPHCVGLDKLPMLDNEEIIKTKLEMLESLLEMEVAYGLMKPEKGEKSTELHPIDSQYTKLNSKITLLDRDSEEFGHLQAYVRNTHAETHQQYELDILEVFKVERHGEDKTFKPHKKLPNRKLLWHGSRTTNYAGILSKGLRIAPPEAPVTGYMFGKGIYFADMVSKSANYCFTSKKNNVGLLLLCEVALGNIEERTRADYIQSLPKGKHSVKGVGKTHPNPEHAVVLPHGVEVPLGPPTHTGIDKTELLYNEYIVYDSSQVKIEYLLKLNFKYKY